MKGRILLAAAACGLAACSAIIGHIVHCPTLWLQVEKSEPAPWPEVAQQSAIAPHEPAAMQNRFDVIAKPPGTRVEFAQRYQDRFDPRDDVDAAKTYALADAKKILDYYNDSMFDQPCSMPAVKAEVKCSQPGGVGAAGQCDTLETTFLSGKKFQLVLVDGSPFYVFTIDDDDAAQTSTINLSSSVNAKENDTVTVCPIEALEFSRTLLSFIHLSDVQLRDPSVVLTDRAVSRRLDWFTALHSFEYDEDLAFYNQYLVEAMVATINAAASTSTGADKPDFVIHTGDSIDSNVMSELVRFHKVIDRLVIPFFELIGNHDILVFGNLTPTDVPDSDKTCTPVASLLGEESSFVPDKLCVEQAVRRCATCSPKEAEFVATAKGHAKSRERFMEQLGHTTTDRLPAVDQFPTPGGDDPYCAKPWIAPMNRLDTRAHGFDLNTRTTDMFAPASDRLGYYAFARPLQNVGTDARNAVFIALDTEDLEDGHGGVTGRVGAEQLAWLGDVLACVHPKDLVFVFGHQPLSLVNTEPPAKKTDAPSTVAGLLEKYEQNVVAYIYGHDHEHKICGDSGRKGSCAHFWEIETGSLVEFPQEARMVRIKQLGKSIAFLDVSTFGENLVRTGSELERYVQLARRGAERDHCITHEARCSDDQRPYRTDGHHTAGRLFFKLPRAMYIERAGGISVDDWRRAVIAAKGRFIGETLDVELLDADGTYKRVLRWNGSSGELSARLYVQPFVPQLQAIARELGAKISV